MMKHLISLIWWGLKRLRAVWISSILKYKRSWVERLATDKRALLWWKTSNSFDCRKPLLIRWSYPVNLCIRVWTMRITTGIKDQYFVCLVKSVKWRISIPLFGCPLKSRVPLVWRITRPIKAPRSPSICLLLLFFWKDWITFDIKFQFTLYYLTYWLERVV